MKRYFSSIILFYKITIISDQPLLVPSLLLHTLNTALTNSSQIKTEYCMEQFFYMCRHKPFSAVNLVFVLHRPNALMS